VIDQNVLGDPTCLLGAVLGVGVDPTDAPVGVGDAQSVGDGAEVLTRGLLWDHPRAVSEEVREVDPVTVQAWMGHASIATTNLYLHHLGTTADRAGLDRLNRRGHTGDQRSVIESE
jgi:hypothetical protein